MILVTVAVSCDVCGVKFDTEAHFPEPVDEALHLEQFGYWELVEMAQAEGWTLMLVENSIFCPLHGPEDEVQVEPDEGVPSSTNYERCETYTPALKGSYGITLQTCFYYNVGQVDWLAEIDRTGQLDADNIMNVWRNSVVGDVAKSVKMYTPEALSDDRSVAEQAIFENVTPWFNERGVALVSLSFKNWDFTSEAVANAFDESIVTQRKIAEQAALLQAAKISREREEYEAETARLVSEKQKEALNLLGLKGSAAVDYLWIKYLTEKDEVPDVLILGRGGGETPISIPAPGQQWVKPDDTD